MSNLRRNLQKYLYPELYLTDTINENINKGLSYNIDYNSIFRAFVVSGGYAKNNNELIDTTESGDYKIIYPKGYVRAYVLGLDDGLPPKYCRVFKPISNDNTEISLVDFDMINVTFEDENFSSGIWLGKISDTNDINYKSLMENYGYFEEINSNDLSLENIENYIDFQKNNNIKFGDGNQIILGWPVETGGKSITSKYGNRVLDGQSDDHGGIDIRGRAGEYILAAYDGYVNKVKENGEFTYIELAHKNPKNGLTFYTRYGHTDRFLYNTTGPFVKAGNRIAKISSRITGRSTAPHLHFEVLINYPEGITRVDPEYNEACIIRV